MHGQRCQHNQITCKMKAITKNTETGKLEYQSEELNSLYKLLAEKDKLIRQWEHWALTSNRVN